MGARLKTFWAIGRKSGRVAWIVGAFLSAQPATAQVPAQRERLALTLLTFNLCATCDKRDERLDLIAREIQRLDPDIVALQEVMTWPWNFLKKIRETIPYEYSYYKTAPKGISGLAILSRYPLTRQKNHPLPGKTGWILSHGLLNSTVNSPLGPIEVYTTQLIPNHMENPKRDSQWATVAEKIGENPSLNPQILMGDLNAREEGRLQRSIKADWIDTFRTANPDAAAEPGYTWDREKNRNISASEWPDWPSVRIDYIYVIASNEGETDVKVLESRLVLKQPDPKGAFPSDHFGVLSKIEISRPEIIALLLSRFFRPRGF
ncbi:MAG: endonuclease/exonuclease/phosphatase family protein [Elusimicrobia bacterium]|nr:endonuclease/exonuclease/phosphatase family protein [Elusimicrobiota bacterium]